MRVEFPIYRVISTRRPTKTKKGGMEIAVLTVRNGGLRSVNRHLEMEGGRWIGRHPNYYNGVDMKNIDAEQMFAGLENGLAGLKQKLVELDEEIAQWTDLKRLNEFVTETAIRFNLNRGLVLNLFLFVQQDAIRRLKVRRSVLEADIANVGVKKEHAKKCLADVQRDFPRLVSYVGVGGVR